MMTVEMIGGNAFASSFTTGRIPAMPISLERLARRDPWGVLCNLLNRSERASQAGNKKEAEALVAEAERLFQLVA